MPNAHSLRIVALAFLLGCTTAFAAKISTVEMSGDKSFDSDSIANSDANQWRWLSYPGARFSLNPAAPGTFVVPPMGKDLPLNIGGYLGQGVLRLQNVVNIRMPDHSAADVNAGLAESVSSTWYPYKLEYRATFAGGATASVRDFFLGRYAIVRVIEASGSADTDLYLSGAVTGSEGAAWDKSNGVLVVSDSKYRYALCFVELAGKQLAPRELPFAPEVVGKAWRLRIPVNGQPLRIAVSFGFAAAVEGKDKAIFPAKKAFWQPIRRALKDFKGLTDEYLRKVPAPEKWGLSVVKTEGVTPEQHRRAYYAAWAFLTQDLMEAFPENPEYPYMQVGVGKPSLWDGGERTSPGTCSWESLMGYQWLSHCSTHFGWGAYEGLMSRVDAEGKLGGESLPSRKAQTAWVLYKRTGDQARLGKVYPAVKRYLLWREANLRWIWKEHDFAGERDLEFVVSWLADIDYARQIAAELKLADDVQLWKGKVEPTIAKMREWFFDRDGKVYQYAFVDAKTHAVSGRTAGGPIYIASALSVKGLPEDMLARVQEQFRRVHRPERANAGFPYTKYPPNSFVATGLLDHGMPEARPFVEAILRDSIRIGEFTEDILDGPRMDGVRPSLFTPLNIIEFTWLLNGVRVDSGSPVEFKFEKTGD